LIEALKAQHHIKGEIVKALLRRYSRTITSANDCFLKQSQLANGLPNKPDQPIRNIEARLAGMDATGVDMQIVMPPRSQCYYTVPQAG
jgi:hypothetical protein